MSSQVSPDSNASPPSVPPAFTPRPKQDPPGMSALFVAVTAVCALGASSILISTRDGGLSGTIDGIVASIGRSAETVPGSAGAVQLDAKPLRPSTAALAAAVHGSAQAASDELARVGGEVTALKKEVSSVKNLITLSLTRDGDGAFDAAVAAALEPVKSEIKELALGLAAVNGEVKTIKSSVHVVYSSIDQMTSAHIKDIAAVNNRIGKVEDVISLRADVTSAIPTRSMAPLPRKRAPRRAGWTAEETETGSFVVRGPTGSFEVSSGGYVPGLGRVDFRRQDGKVRMVTSKDAVVHD